MKVIQEQKEFHISIKDLIYASLERRFHTTAIPLSIRASKGTELHQKIQKARKNTENNFQREVLIRIQTTVKDWDFIISGRADVVYEKDGKWIIEEIKSVSNLNDFSLGSQIAQEYRLQLLLYAHYFHHLGKVVQCNLILIDIFTEETKIINIHQEDLSDYIQTQCEVVLASWENDRKLKATQRDRAKTLVFPFETYRPHQLEIIEKTATCVKNRDRLMLLAPSGLGKTVGTLFPSLKYALKNNNRVFVVTSKTTQQHIYRETLRLFSRKKAKFNSIILTAKEKMCINANFICEKTICPFLENYEKVSLDKILTKTLKKQVLDSRYIRKIGREHTICPFELSLDCSLQCDVIVGDYNYVFHPHIKLRRFFDHPSDDIILIVDEAHNLPFRAMTYYSPEISLQTIKDTETYLRSTHLSNDLKRDGIILYQRVSDYILSIVNQFSDLTTNKPILIKFDKKFFWKILKDYEQYLLTYIKVYSSQQGFQPKGKDKVVEFALILRDFSKILKESDSPEYSELLYPVEKKIKILCKSAAQKLEKQIAGFHTAIIQSATLFPIEYFRKMVGFPSSAKKMKLNSPFPTQNRLYLIVPNLSTRFEDRQESYDQIARVICDTLKIKNGNYLAFFPSFAYLKAVKREIEARSPPIKLIVQERRMSESNRRKYLKKMKNSEQNYLLLAVHGGIFSEGVDFIGDMAIGAFIIGLGLPAFSTEQELMRKYFQFKWKKGFEYAYRNPGMMKVIQAAGRIFRTSTDRGFVMLIGYRFSTRYYNSILPADWKLEYSSNLIKRIDNFWNIKPKDMNKKYPKTIDLFDFVEKG